MARIESLLSARLFIAPRSIDGRLYFLSNIGGHLSLYTMKDGGSVPEPLLPPHIALQNPDLLDGYAFCVFPSIGKIVVMMDADGDEKYQPMLVPIEGGFPEPAFGGALRGYRCHLASKDEERCVVYFNAESEVEAVQVTFRGNVATGALEDLARSRYGGVSVGASLDHKRVAVVDGYTMGDHVLYLWEAGKPERRLLAGTPIEKRTDGMKVPLTAFDNVHFVNGDRGLLMRTALFEDAYGLGYLALEDGGAAGTAGAQAGVKQDGSGGRSEGKTPGAGGSKSGAPVPETGAAQGVVENVAVTETVHGGAGELVGLDHIEGDRWLVEYNIDGSSWLYEGAFDAGARRLALDTVICGLAPLDAGVLADYAYDAQADRYVLSFSTAVSPTQIVTVERKAGKTIRAHTNEKILGVGAERLSPGEDASFESFDGTRVSARIYRPAPVLGFTGRRPLVYYVHGGPQSQERPNFAWFSMPLIQFLTLRGFTVFVPNARGSTGYGLSYTKQVDRDWGGRDRLDHAHAMKLLEKDTKIDVSRAGVVGRSYGGYMTLTLAARHPELWSAAIDMFGPFDLITFYERIPETWRPYMDIAIGNPVTDRDFLVDRSPRTHIAQIRCPLMVIQGRNDPRVVERESRDLVEHLRAQGKEVEYLVFENEGHDVLKFENRVRCYDAIADFFAKCLKP